MEVWITSLVIRAVRWSGSIIESLDDSRLGYPINRSEVLG